MMKAVLNHVAILVGNIDSILEKNQFPSNFLGQIEEFPKEGTKELYIGSSNQMGKLLLMETIGNGPYKDALIKRGEGLHHIALDVLNIDEYIASLSGTGWLLHPKSLSFYKSSKQVFLCRPGIPILIEVQEKEKLKDKKYFIQELQFPFEKKQLLTSLKCKNLELNDEVKIKINDDFLLIKDLI